MTTMATEEKRVTDIPWSVSENIKRLRKKKKDYFNLRIRPGNPKTNQDINYRILTGFHF